MSQIQLTLTDDGNVKAQKVDPSLSSYQNLTMYDDDPWWLNDGWLKKFASAENNGEAWNCLTRRVNASMFLSGKFSLGMVYIRLIEAYDERYRTTLGAFLVTCSPQAMEMLKICEAIQTQNGSGYYRPSRNGIDHIKISDSVEYDVDGNAYALSLFSFGNYPVKDRFRLGDDRWSDVVTPVRKYSGMTTLFASGYESL